MHIALLFALPITSQAEAVVGPVLTSAANGQGVDIDMPTSFQISGAPPQAQVYLFMTLAGEGRGRCVNNGPCLAIAEPTRSLPGRASAGGTKAWSVTPPFDYVGEQLCVQAGVVTARGVVLSNVVCEDIGVHTSFDGAAWWFPGQSMTFADASAYCADHEMHVVTPTQVGAVEFISFFNGAIDMASATPWLGVTDVASEGTWLNPDGQAAWWFNWAANQPDDANDQDCAVQQADGSWTDEACDSVNEVICQGPQVF